MRVITYAIVLMIYGFGNVGCSDSEIQCVSPMDPSAALTIAGEYIQKNGYTDIETRPEDIVLEPIESKRDRRMVLNQRSGTLVHKPIGYLKVDSGWQVLFRYTSRLFFNDKEFFRVVYIDDCTGFAVIEHENMGLLVDKTKPSEGGVIVL